MNERDIVDRLTTFRMGQDTYGLRQEAADEIERLREVLRRCDTLFRFDLNHMTKWGDHYNQAVKDVADATHQALKESDDADA